MKSVFFLCSIFMLAAMLASCSNAGGNAPDESQTQTAAILHESSPTTGASLTSTPTFPPTDTPLPPTATVVPTLGIGSRQVSAMDGMVLLYVPAGTFLMGDTIDEAMAICRQYNSNCQTGWFTDEEPRHTVSLEAYWIDQTEVTNGMYAQCAAAGKCAPPVSNGSETRDSYYGNPAYNDFPVVFVSWEEADAYCSWAGRRLPTEAEWEKAASWDEIQQVQFTFPWGNGTNDCSFSNYPDGSEDCVGDTTAVGAYPSGISPYGALDMIGNVWEWVADWYGDRYYWTLADGTHDPTGPAQGEYHAVRGGSYEANTYIHNADRDFGENGATNFLGFRCALTP
jgi:formylglycine-generating enzyme required for sulfatase activity